MWRNHQDHIVPACSKGVDLFNVFISTWFSLNVLNPRQNHHRVLRSILWSFQVFERRRPPEMSLEWINHQMIKWSIFSRPKRTHISSSGQNESTSCPYFFWVKVDFENHRLKVAFPGGKYASSRGFGLLTNFCSPLKHRNPAWRTSSHKSMRLCFREGRSKSTSL